ncbi:MAG: hypothetical protein K8I02_09390, partial [Candidatus Methylomirabilis sp.]|nr:hypothetical protein [Deltaproteobacteria bacterium]
LLRFAPLAWGAEAAPLPPEKQIEGLILKGARENFEGRWGDAERTFARIPEVDPAHPAGPFYPVTTAFWRIAADYSDDRYDDFIVSGLEETIRLAEARTERDAKDAEAYLYRGQALAYLGRLKAQKGDYFEGGSKAEEGRADLEKALALRPADAEAKFPLGAYNFYASLLPAALRFFDWLWFIPQGDADLGLRMLEACLRECAVNRLGAEYVLFDIYAKHAVGTQERALEIGRSLRRRFPDNAIFHVDLARLLLAMGRNAEAILETVRIQAKVLRGARTYDESVDNIALLVRARGQLQLGEPEAAEATLARFSEDGPHRPGWLHAWVLVTRAQALDARGKRAEAVLLYERVADMDEPRRDVQAAMAAEAYLERRYKVSPPK